MLLGEAPKSQLTMILPVTFLTAQKSTESRRTMETKRPTKEKGDQLANRYRKSARERNPRWQAVTPGCARPSPAPRDPVGSGSNWEEEAEEEPKSMAKARPTEEDSKAGILFNDGGKM